MTKPRLALSVVYLSIFLIVLLFIRAPFYVLLVFVDMCCLLVVWLSCQYLPSDWLESRDVRKTEIRFGFGF